MSKFLTSLRVEEIEDTSHDGRGTWRLLEDLIYLSDVANRLIRVPAGFVTDYASVPRVPVAYLLAGDTCHPASVVHDYLYTCHAVSRDIADAVLQEASIATGVPAWRAYVMWAAVRAAGGSHWDLPATPQAPMVQSVLDHAGP